ncbi:MAG: DUF4296 domain-containing protein [Bacteroidia bacterium]|nr:DUF4296 domain-containing protein [Bacteroidia bacterium]NNF32107.1 DUF4296 domain-containing protein [Flavobacteriaceae bacterium]MBT8275146.1 DUF4296 domain-containing protein [Bacteroidia bacterium]NNJ82243.1 DUF4296 domain-containing protein [Flavobacteriaceae bacterium]NNK54971.1 DUF4296 domain-containing protein [Flavobacteriaceae bacterium]
MRLVLVVISLLFLAGCQNVEKPEEPQDLIPKELMVDILTDAYISNAAKSVNNKVIRQKGIKLDSLIYKKYGIDSLQFVESHAWYNADLDLYNEIFKEIEDRLEAMKKKVDSASFPGKSNIKRKQDSLRDAKGLIDPAESE